MHRMRTDCNIISLFYQVKIEAIYRNELLDDILNMIKIV